MPEDSMGNTIKVGDRVRFEDRVYTIKKFVPGGGLLGAIAIEFVEETEFILSPPDELNVDLVRRQK